MDIDPDNLLRSEDIRHAVNEIMSDGELSENTQVYDSDEDLFQEDDNNDEVFMYDTDNESPNNTMTDNDQLPSPDIPQMVNITPNACELCKWQHNNNFEPTKYDFDSSECGLDLEFIDNNPKEIDIFHQLFDFDFLSHISEETNKYARSCMREELKEFSKVKRWVDTNPDEVYCFFAIMLLMPHTRKNSLKQYWSTDPLLETPIFGKTFSQDRFLLLLRMIHFDDNLNKNGGDKLYKLRTVIETIRRKFSSHFKPSQNLVIDESLILWKGRLSFKQYIPSKRKRFGIKLFVLCDCASGIVLDFIVYTGKTTNLDRINQNDVGISGNVIQTLLQPYLGLNHIIYMDNWYSSPNLYDWLHNNNTGACGTVRVDRKGLPCLPKKMHKGETAVRHDDIKTVVRWCDRRNVTMMSTVHKHEMVDIQKNGTTVQKPLSVVEYTKNMGAVDRTDMIVSFNDTTRKTNKWYRKLFFHILDITALNSHYMLQLKTGKNNLSWTFVQT